MMLKDPIHIVWEISPSVPHYLMKIYPLLDSWEMKIQIIHVSRDTGASCHLVAPFILNEHIHPFGIIIPKIIVICILWSNYSFRFLKQSVKFRLVQYDKFYICEHKKDASESLMMLIELINKGSVPYCGFNDNNSTGVSLSEILFSFMLEKYIVCDACGLRSPSFESSSVLCITPTCTSSMQELIKQGMNQKLETSCFRCKNTWHVESNYHL